MKLSTSDVLYGISDTELCDLLEKDAWDEANDNDYPIRENLAYVAMTRLQELINEIKCS